MKYCFRSKKEEKKNFYMTYTILCTYKPRIDGGHYFQNYLCSTKVCFDAWHFLYLLLMPSDIQNKIFNMGKKVLKVNGLYGHNDHLTW